MQAADHRDAVCGEISLLRLLSPPKPHYMSAIKTAPPDMCSCLRSWLPDFAPPADHEPKAAEANNEEHHRCGLGHGRRMNGHGDDIKEGHGDAAGELATTHSVPENCGCALTD